MQLIVAFPTNCFSFSLFGGSILVPTLFHPTCLPFQCRTAFHLVSLRQKKINSMLVTLCKHSFQTKVSVIFDTKTFWKQTFDLSSHSHCIGTGPHFLIWSGPTPQTRKGPKTCISFISTEGALKRPITYDQSPASAWGLQAIPFFSRWKYENFHPLYPKGEGLGRPTIQYTLWKNSSMLPTGQRKHPPTFI